jgi:hypothetical protein
MKKKWFPLAIALLVVIAVLFSRRFLGAEEKPIEVTLKGTVVDMHCFVTHGIHDADHTGCANACIARGVPAGFLADDGQLYVLFEQKPQSVKERVKNLADVPVTVKGTVVSRGGVKGLQIQSIARQKT